jgi:Transglutaminase-like superfamily
VLTRFVTPEGVKRLLAYLPGAGAGLILAVVVALLDLPDTARTLGVGCVAASLAFALLARAEEVRSNGAATFGIFAVTAAGWTRGGLAYGGACVLYALLVVFAMRGGRLRLQAGTAARAFLVFVTAAATVTGIVALGLPIVGKLIARRIASAAYGGAGDSMGFTSELRMGGFIDMLGSDAVVMRVYGRRPALVRGAVLDRYESWLWTGTREEERALARADAREEATTTRIVVSRKAHVARGAEARWFLPSGACDLRTETGKVGFDEMAIAHPLVDEDVVAFRMGCASDEGARAPAAPRATDLEVPERVAKDLAPIAARFTGGASDDRAKVAAITRALQGYGYSLSAARSPRMDPVVDFLTVHKEGLCEDFASALALLARSSGIPARVVVGYRVEEDNPLGGYAVVRDRNAHSWVEAWVDGAWRTVDPTPLVEGRSHAPSFTEQLGDFALALRDRIAVFGMTKILAIGFALVVGALGAQRLAQLVFARRATRARAAARGASLPEFVALEGSLARAGHARDPSEPIESFARRLSAQGVDGSGAPLWRADVATALLGYADLRYGGVGDEALVAATLTRAASRVGSSQAH